MIRESIAKQYLDLALQQEKSVRIQCPSHEEARRMRFRIYNVRRDYRRASKKLFAEGEPGYGSSPYDHFEIILKDVSVIIIPEPSMSEFSVVLGEFTGGKKNGN